MPLIILIEPGQPVANFAVDGTTVTVAGIAVDCAAAQRDEAVTVEIRDNAGTPGIGGDGAYLATIRIPTARYAPADGGEGGESSPEIPLPLDPNTIEITLWPTA